MNKRGNLTLFFVFLVVATIIIVLSAVVAPLMVSFNTDVYRAGEGILLQANESVSNIQNASVRASVYGSINEALGATQTNIDIGTDVFQYGWVILLVLTAITIFLAARSLVETSGRFAGGGFVG